MDLAGGDDDADDTVGDEDEVDLPLGRPLHPDDRLWRHPSELAPVGAPATYLRGGSARSGGGPGRPALDRWLPAVLAGTLSALLTAGLLGMTGALDGDASGVSASSSSVTLAERSASSAPGPARLAELIRPSLLALAGVTADGQPARGSAVAIRPGHVLTAARLVIGTRQLEVQVQGVGRRATLVGADRDTDLAVLAVEGGGLVPVAWAEAAVLEPGTEAVAVSCAPAASPGLTVTAGIVSGVGRTMTYDEAELRGLLQFDRPVPTEGAGGALVDRAGALVGITLPSPAGTTPFGYAVPAEEAQEVAGQLLTNGRVAHPWLGIEGGDFGMDGGAHVKRVRPASPAALAGLIEGDVVTSLDGRPTPSMGMLLLRLRVHQPGDTVRLTLLRAGRRLDLPATLADRP